jgi:hypothetical protein
MALDLLNWPPQIRSTFEKLGRETEAKKMARDLSLNHDTLGSRSNGLATPRLFPICEAWA